MSWCSQLILVCDVASDLCALLAAYLTHSAHVMFFTGASGRRLRFVSDVNSLLADESRAAVECHSLLASCFFAVARQARAGRVRWRRAGVDVIDRSAGDEGDKGKVQDGVRWKVGDVIKHRKHGYTGVDNHLTQRQHPKWFSAHLRPSHTDVSM